MSEGLTHHTNSAWLVNRIENCYLNCEIEDQTFPSNIMLCKRIIINSNTVHMLIAPELECADENLYIFHFSLILFRNKLTVDISKSYVIVNICPFYYSKIE